MKAHVDVGADILSSIDLPGRADRARTSRKLGRLATSMRARRGHSDRRAHSCRRGLFRCDHIRSTVSGNERSRSHRHHRRTARSMPTPRWLTSSWRCIVISRCGAATPGITERVAPHSQGASAGAIMHTPNRMSDSSTTAKVEELLAFVSLRVRRNRRSCATSRGWRGAMCAILPGRQRGDLHR